MRNLLKHRDMFSETSHHGKIPFWAKTYLIWGGRGKGQLALKNLATPGNFSNPGSPLVL
jgi:hypothetical protein